MADPVSWFVIEPGWRVDDASGTEVGRVLEVVGDSNADIFDGVVIAFSAFDKPRYVPSEQVGEIVEGRVRVKLDRPAIERLAEFREPPVEETIEPVEPHLTERFESAVAPPPTRPTSIPLLRRILLWFGLAGKR
ncbi:MAG: hypothetical protein ACJ76I_05150 [Gaiellaceae bacterium]